MPQPLYPTSLPGVSEFVLAPIDQRGVTNMPGLKRYRDRAGAGAQAPGKARVRWVMTAAELDIFEAWHRDDLFNGAAQFFMQLPITPDSGAPADPWYSVCCFATPPSEPLLAGTIFAVTAEIDIRDRFEGVPYPFSQVVEVDAIDNAAATSVNGVVLSGLNPSKTYSLSLPSGQLYTAYSENAGAGWLHFINVTTTGGDSIIGNVTSYGSAEAARAAFPGGTIAGYSSYTFWINDVVLADNLGGLSILVEEV